MFPELLFTATIAMTNGQQDAAVRILLRKKKRLKRTPPVSSLETGVFIFKNNFLLLPRRAKAAGAASGIRELFYFLNFHVLHFLNKHLSDFFALLRFVIFIT